MRPTRRKRTAVLPPYKHQEETYCNISISNNGSQWNVTPVSTRRQALSLLRALKKFLAENNGKD